MKTQWYYHILVVLALPNVRAARAMSAPENGRPLISSEGARLLFKTSLLA